MAEDPVRCSWCLGSEIEIRYHDEDWGTPMHDDRRLFEFLTLEGAQAGLSWSTILKKREGYRHLFDGFDIEKVAAYDRKKIETLLKNPAIIRNRLKVESTVSNARTIIAMQEAHDSFDGYLWQFSDGRTIQNHWHRHDQIPAHTPLSDTMSKQMKKDGFRFVGTTICYAMMQAIGMVNDHTTDCYRHSLLSDS